MRDREKRTLNVVIENVTEAQEIALNDLFATWMTLGNWGSSRWTAFYADGDGDFHPKITVNGEKAKYTELVPRERMWPGGHHHDGKIDAHGEYRIDFDWIGWKLAEIEEKANSCTPENPDRTKSYHNWPSDGSEDTVCPNCGLPWKESKYYHPPTDWSITPHVAEYSEGGTVCWRCGKSENPLHMLKLDHDQQEEASQ